MAYSRLLLTFHFCACIFVAAASSDVDEPKCTGLAMADDYSTLLSIKSSLVVNPLQKHQTEALKNAVEDDVESISTSQADDKEEALHNIRSAKAKKWANGIIFVKMIKVGGEGFSALLSEFAHKQGWRALQHNACSEASNPLGQATCECDETFIAPEDLPPEPQLPHELYSTLYTHMHYNPKALAKYMRPGAMKVVIIRDPISVLKSAHAMAAYQSVYEPYINDNFCQGLAADGDAWRSKCEFVQTGQDSILDYLDEYANKQLLKLFSMKLPPQELSRRALPIIDNVAKLLEDEFVVGLQENYDESMLLFESALEWDRADILYDNDTITHHYGLLEVTSQQNIPTHNIVENSPVVEKAMASWHTGTPEGEQIIEEFNRGPYYYYTLLYKRGVEIHQRQVSKMLGDDSAVAAEVEAYRKQNEAFLTCTDKVHFTQGWGEDLTCTVRGLSQHVEARKSCSGEAQSTTSPKATAPK